MEGILGGIGDFFSGIFSGKGGGGDDDDISGARAGLSGRASGAKASIAGGRDGGAWSWQYSSLMADTTSGARRTGCEPRDAGTS